MAALTKDRSTPTRHPEGGRRIVAFPVAANTVIFKGALVAINATGFARPAADVAAIKVVGIALEQVVNNPGADGAKSVAVAAGAAFKLPHTGIVAANLAQTAVVSDDQTLTNAATALNDIAVGMIEEIVGGEVWVYIGPTA